MRLVYEACKAVQIPVIGLGGITDPEDAMEYILAGATAVQVGTAHFVDPNASVRLVRGLEQYCSSINAREFSDLRGRLQQ